MTTSQLRSNFLLNLNGDLLAGPGAIAEKATIFKLVKCLEQRFDVWFDPTFRQADDKWQRMALGIADFRADVSSHAGTPNSLIMKSNSFEMPISDSNIDEVVSQMNLNETPVDEKRTFLIAEINMPRKLFQRSNTRFRDVLDEMFEQRSSNRLSLMSGNPGCGKTSFLLEQLQSSKLTRNVIWVNLYKFREVKSFQSPKIQTIILNHILKFGSSRFRNLTSLDDLFSTYREPLLVFDDIYTFEMLEYLRNLIKLPFICLTNDVSLAIMKLNSKFHDITSHVETLPPMNDKELTEILKQNFPEVFRQLLKQQLVDFTRLVKGSPKALLNLTYKLSISASAFDFQVLYKSLFISRTKRQDLTKTGVRRREKAVERMNQLQSENQEKTDSEKNAKRPFSVMNSPAIFEPIHYLSRPSDEQNLSKNLSNYSKVLKHSQEGSVFLLQGPLGSGKTCLLKFFLENETYRQSISENYRFCFWLPCHGFNETGLETRYQQSKFLQALKDVGALKATRDEVLKWTSIGKMLNYFEDQSIRAMVVLDGVENQSILDYYCAEQGDRTFTCVTTSSLEPRLEQDYFYEISPWNETELSGYLESQLELRDKLCAEQLRQLALRCGGNPLAAQTLASFLQYSNPRSRIDQILHEFPKNPNFDSEDVNAFRASIRSSMPRLGVLEGTLYFALILVDPEELLSQKELESIVNQSSPETDFLIRDLARKGWLQQALIQDLGDPSKFEYQYFMNSTEFSDAVQFLKMVKATNGDVIGFQLSDIRIRMMQNIASDFGLLGFLLHVARNEQSKLLMKMLSKFENDDFGNVEPPEELSDKSDDMAEHLLAVLMAAVHFDHFKLVQIICLQFYPNFIRERSNSLGDTPLMRAAQRGHLNLVKFLYEQWPEAISLQDGESRNGKTALLHAAKEGWVEICKFLLALWPDGVNVQEQEYGKNALMISAEYGHFELVQMFHETWPDGIMIESNDGRSALGYAAWNGNVEIIEFLYEKWPDGVKLANKAGKIPLMKAIEKGNLEAVRSLSEKWPDGLLHISSSGKMNQSKQDGTTCLMLACGKTAEFWLKPNLKENESLALVKFILETKPEVANLKDQSGKTAADYAKRNNWMSVLNLLT